MKSDNKTIYYTYFCLDIFHKGHIEAMKKHRQIAGEDGKIIAGILTDKAVEEKKQKPIISFEERFEIANSIKYIDKVVPQKTYSPIDNLKKIKPNILIESSSHNKNEIKLYQKYMASINGEVIIIPYYEGQSSTKIKLKIKKKY